MMSHCRAAAARNDEDIAAPPKGMPAARKARPMASVVTRIMRSVFAVSVAGLLSACGGNGPTAPGAATAAAVPFGLAGGVSDTAGRPLAGVRVEVLDGAQKGAVAVTGEAGAFAFGPIFTSTFTLRASKEGRLDQSRLISSAQSDSFFKLELDLRGNYEVMFAADAGCTDLPSAARTRTYVASFASSGPSAYLVTLSGADFARNSSYPDYNVLYANVVGDAGHVFFSDPEIWEHLTRETDVSPQTDLVIIGDASGTLQGNVSHWAFGGTFTYCPTAEPGDYWECEVPEIRCTSQNHQFTLTRK